MEDIPQQWHEAGLTQEGEKQNAVPANVMLDVACAPQTYNKKTLGIRNKTLKQAMSKYVVFGFLM